MITDQNQVIAPDHAAVILESSKKLIQAVIFKDWGRIYEILDTNEEGFKDNFEKYSPKIEEISSNETFQSSKLRVLHNIELKGLDTPDEPYFLGNYTVYYEFSNGLDFHFNFTIRQNVIRRIY
jgi:hypothetical protein